MTIFASKPVKLRDINPASYVPPFKGLDVIWGYDSAAPKDLYATFTAGNVNHPQYVTDRSEINNALSRLKVIQDTIKDYKTYRKVTPLGPKRITLHDDGNRYREDKL